MDSQSNNVVVASPGGDGGLRAFVLAPTQRATKRTSEEITSSKITLTKKAKLSIEAAEETLVVEPAGEEDQVITASGPEDSQEEDHLTTISTLETSTNNLAEEEEEEGDYPDSATTTRSVEVPDNNSGPQSEEVTLGLSREASEVGDYHGDSSGSDLESTEDEESPVFPDIDLDEDFDDDLEDDLEGDLEGEDEREEGPFSGPDYVIYSQSTSTSSQEDFSPELNSQDTTGYSLGDIEL